MADMENERKSNIKAEIKENKSHPDKTKRASEVAPPPQYPLKVRAQRMPSEKPRDNKTHAYSNYDRETEITVEIPKTLLSEIEKAKPQKPTEQTKSPTEKSTKDTQQRKKTAARSVDDLRKSKDADNDKTNVFSRVTVAVNAKSEQHRIKNSSAVRDKLRDRKAKSEQRKQKTLHRRNSTALGRFFLDDGLRYTEKTVDEKQRVTQAERVANKLTEFLYFNKVIKASEKLTVFLRQCEAKAYGVALIIFGLLTLVAYFVSARLPFPYTADWTTLIVAVLAIALALPLLLSKISILGVFEKSFIIGNIVFDFFGLRRSGNDTPWRAPVALPICAGLILGATGFFVSPIFILGILVLAVFFALVMSTPEFGLAVLVFLLPFLSAFEHPTVVMCAIIVLCYLSYMRKLAMGKRNFHFRPCDLFVLLFSLFYLGGGIFSYAKDGSSVESSLVYFCIISVYFLAVNLMANKRIIDTMTKSLVLSAFIISVLGIFEQMSGYTTADWLDTDAYAYISGRISTVFENPNVLASYFVLVIPFALVYTFERGRFAGKNIFNALTLICLCCALTLTWSRGAWVGIVVGLLTLCAFVFRRSPKLVVAILAGIPNLLLFAPDSVWQRIASAFSFLGNDVDSSIAYRLTVWRDCLRMFADHILGGIGTGIHAFSEAYIGYASPGAEMALHSHNLFLQIGIELGVFALILFALILVYTYRYCYSMEFAANQSSARPVCLAAFSAVTALIANGMTDYVWYNYRICFLFWLVLGICNASYKIATEEQRYNDFVQTRISTFASVDVPFKK